MNAIQYVVGRGVGGGGGGYYYVCGQITDL